jgi:hypothetical protein
MPLVINNPERFAQFIEKKVASGLSYMDAILDFCAKLDLEPEAVAPYIVNNSKIMGALEREGRSLHLLNPKKCGDPLPF